VIGRAYKLRAVLDSGRGLTRALTAMACALLLLVPLSGCERRHADEARKIIRTKHAPHVAQIVSEDMQRHTQGLRHAADRIAAGFVKVSGEQQEREVRQVLKLLRSPKKGVPELVISPLSFIAAVGKDGLVIARDSEPDKMKGMKLAEMFPVVKDALAGKEGYEIGQFESFEKGAPPSVTVVMAAPAHYGGEVVGALVLGIPLWRMQQRLSKQLQMEEAGKKQGVVIWVYLYRGDELHNHGTPRDLDQIVPNGEARRAGYAKSPGGFTGEVQQYSYWYGYGVRPLRMLGDDIGMIVFRMDPQ
jgi:hypothetical protein